MSVQRLDITFEDGRSYLMRIGPRILQNLGVHLRALGNTNPVFIITDENVAPLYLEQLEAGLDNVEISHVALVIPAGEEEKNLMRAQTLWEALLEKGCNRNCNIVALGGGVIGDLAAFVAAIYMRGIPCIQVPTTLLAMVDASIGGKCGLDLPQAKNVVGVIKQPYYVAADVDVLASLPVEHWASGFAEAVKTAALMDDDACIWLADNAGALNAHDAQLVQELIVQTAAFKAEQVTADELEQSTRVCLNYGHTLGHALEAVLGYGAISHGQAVADGMRFAAHLTAKIQGIEPDFALAQDDLLDSLGLTKGHYDLDVDELMEAMHYDKKNQGQSLRFVLVSNPGEWKTQEIPDELIKPLLQNWLAE